MSQVHRILYVIVALLLGVCQPVQAENLVSVRSTTLPALPASLSDSSGLSGLPPGEPLQALTVLDGRPLALSRQTAWLLSEDGKTWGTTPWAAPAPLQAVVGRGSQVFALLGTEGMVQDVYRLALTQGLPTLSPWTQLPNPLTQARGATLVDKLFVAGLKPDGQSQLLQIDTQAEPPAWRELVGWPGGGRPSSLVGQTAALFATFANSGGEGTPTERMLRWSADRGWTEMAAVPGRVVAGSGRAMGQAHILYLVSSGEAGTAPKLMSLHTITGSWAVLATPDTAGAGLTAAWNNGVIWARSGADGAPQFAFAEVEPSKHLLKWLDWLVIVVYLVSMLGIGLYFYLREKRDSTADFFVGGRSIPFWAAGVSLYAANTSSISYIAIPAKAFETNWQYLTNNLIAVLGLMFVAVWIVPLLRRLDLMSVFSYLETRFHPAIRMLSSGLCILVQLGSRMSVILFLPSLAIATITGLDVVWSILLMGGFTIVYTAMGGMKAVVWTDVVQLVVKMGGALFAIGYMVSKLDGGIGEFFEVAAAANKTKMFDFSFDLTKATVWGFIFLVLFDVVLTFPKDQVLMQRTLSTKNDRDAGRAIWAFALITIPGGFIFYTIGTSLFVFYKAHPERMNPLLSIDATFPLFIAAELPMGVTGLIIAGIFAAAMATLSSIINSVATLASVDFYEKLVKHPDPKKSVRFAELMTVVAGLIGVGFALMLSRYDIHSLFDVSIELGGLLGGGFAGAYTLGMFTRRANSAGVAIGVGGAIVLTSIAWWMKLVHPYFYLAISILLCIVIGYVASLFFPAPTRSLKGLTIYSDADVHREAA